jgi:hypothetical protein
MVTVLENCTTEEHNSVVRFFFFFFFLWTKGLNAKDIHKEMFPVYGGKCLPRLFGPLKNTLVANVSLMTTWLKRRCGSGLDNSQKTSVLRVSTHW